MKSFVYVFLSATLAVGLFAQDAKKDEAKPELKREVKKITKEEMQKALDLMSYHEGRNAADGLAKTPKDRLNVKVFLKAVNDKFAGKEYKADDAKLKEAMALLQKYAQQKQQEMMEQMKKEKVTNAAEIKKFMAEKLTTTKSGLKYKVLKEGKGEAPKATDVVEVHYKGMLKDGTEFDSSYRREQTATFPLNRVIAGWTEGLQLMKPGAKYQFLIPWKLAYGEHGSRSIPPKSDLIFIVELIKVNK